MKLVLLWATRSECSVYKSQMCSQGLRKKLHFCSDLGRRFDGPGRYRRIGMTGEVCTELRVASAPKQQHGREERENTGPGVTKSASSHHDDPRTSRSFTRSPTAELQQTRSVPALWPRTLKLSSAFWRANPRLQHWDDLPSCTAAPRRVRASGGFVNYLRPLRVFCRLSEAQTAADTIQSTTIAPWTGSPQAHLSASRRAREWQNKNQICSKTTSTWIITQTSVILLVSPNLPWDRHI